MKILSFAASNSSTSINRQLVGYAADRLQAQSANTEVEFLDLNDFEMPIYSQDREAAGGIPAEAQAFFDKISAADAVVVSFAEHNGSTTAAWKNIFDWMSRIEMKLWQGKPVVFLAASPGPRAGAGVLGGQIDMAPRFGADLKASHGVGVWSEAWDGTTLTRDEDIAAVDAAMAALLA